MTGFSWDWGFAWSVVPELLAGLRLTVLATLFGSLIALGLGLLFALLRLAEIPLLSGLVRLLIEFLRGTPFLVQLYFLFYVFPTYGLTFSALVTGIIGLGLYYGAYTAEIFRAGIEDVPPGQWEACLALGLPLRRVWAGIILPQAARTVVPVFGNYVIVMFKETALLSTITVSEVLAQANNIGFQHFRFTEPLTLAGLLYLLVSYPAARGIRLVENRLRLAGA